MRKKILLGKAAAWMMAAAIAAGNAVPAQVQGAEERHREEEQGEYGKETLNGLSRACLLYTSGSAGGKRVES